MKGKNNGNETMHHQIIEAARQLFNAKGFDKTTLEDLIERLGIRPHVFFRYFESMDELLEVVWSGS